MERANGYGPLDRGSNPRRDAQGKVLTTVASNLRLALTNRASVVQRLGPLPSKQMMRVRIPSLAP